MGDEQGGVGQEKDPAAPGCWAHEHQGDRGEPQSLGLNTETVCTLSLFVAIPY